MIEKTVQEICNMLHANVHGNIEDTKRIKGVAIDSRKIEKDTLYIPLLGQRADGHDYALNAIKVGAACCLWQADHLPYPDFGVILVEDTVIALQQLAKAYLSTLDCLVIGITGSNGKTSCKDMLCSIFSQERKTQKTQGNRNNELGLPLTILDLDADCEVAILEMGMENKGEIEFLTSIAAPDISIITSIGSAHMENLGDKHGIARAKCEILENTKQNGLFVYNHESEELLDVVPTISREDVHIASFGRGGDIYLTSSIDCNMDGISFNCNLLDEKVFIHTYGLVQAMNALPCIYVALNQGIKPASILAGLEHLELTKMRTQLLQAKQAYILDDSYKSNPESAKAAIDALMELPAKKHIAILADMLDLGSEENVLHYEIGAYAKSCGVDELLCTGPLSKHTAEAFGSWYATKDAIIDKVVPYLEEDCVILVKGSRAMAMDEIVDSLRGKKDEQA